MYAIRSYYGQGVEPDVNDMGVIAGNGDAPGKRGPGNGEVAQAFLDEIEHLVTAALRLDKIRIFLDMPDKLILILAHAEKIRFFLELFRGASAIRNNFV